MWLDNASQDAVDLFWQRCGEIEPFPRNLERPIALALPVAIVKLPRLKLRDLESWLQRRGVAFQFNCQSRAVRGCLIAFGGKGLIFVDGTDPNDELRFTLAHETAHFIVDYWQPREKAIDKFGRAIAEVLDGLRQPTVSERVGALLTNTPIGVHINLMERDEGSGIRNSEVWTIEDRADRIALAFLAPPEAVLSMVDVSATKFDQRQAVITAVLREHFGLPTPVARSYGWSLLSAIGKGPSLVETIGLK
jgi:Zn-dependent peptidase ImmA (M78 family)